MSIIQNQNIRVSDLDFNSIKQSFKDFLATQGEFADYDFDASGMSVLMDILSYNTYYNSVMANYLANETFIDSAVKRDSVVSLAKTLGYRPKSSRSSKATLTMLLTQAAGEPDQLIMKTGTPFETTVRQQTYQFVTMNDVIAANNGGTYNFGTFDVWQGDYNINTYTAIGNAAEKFSLPNSNVDTSSIKVVVQTSASIYDYSYYQPADLIGDLTGDSKVFFIQEGLGYKTEIYFGDGVLGKQIQPGNIVIVTYVTTDGNLANDAKVFNLTGTIEGNNNVQIFTTSSAVGGASAESIDSIKFNATTYFGVQNRAVTANDYRALIQQNFQNVKNVVTWGGEKSDPPEYGKIFICIQPQNAQYLTTLEVKEIKDMMKLKSVANISPQFVNPDYIDVELSSVVYYDPIKSDKNSEQLKTNIKNQIATYADSYLGKFDTTFRYSQLSKVIDQTDYAILNNLTGIKVYKEVLPIINQDNLISFSFNNAMVVDSGVSAFFSTGFSIPNYSQTVYMQDDKNGTVMTYYYDASGAKKIAQSNIGTVNYKTGRINLKKLVITDYLGSVLKLYMTPLKNDILSNNNNIVRIQQSNIVVSLIADTGVI
jgi:hypothetical protein